jgi:hypothetical protein
MAESQYLERAIAFVSRVASILALTGSCAIAFTLVATILAANVILSPLDVEILPAGTTPEKADQFLKSLDEGRRNSIAQQLRIEIQNRPLNVVPVKKLAALVQTSANTEYGNRLVMLAANRIWRDVALQSSALKLELDKKDYAAAVHRLNIVYFTQPTKRSEVMSVLTGLTAPPSFEALVDALAKKPIWREIFLQTLSGNPEVNIDTIYSVFSALRKVNAQPTQNELRAFLQRLVTTGAEDKAYFVWLDSLEAESLRKVGFIHDGGFDLPISNQFFSWTSDKSANVDARIVGRSLGTTDKVFRVDFAPGRTTFAHMTQYLKMAAGKYTLSGEQKADKLVSAVGLVWRVTCVSTKASVLVESQPLSGDQPWSTFETSFVVPEESCDTQTLRLHLNAKATLDTQISGQAQFDTLLIIREK